MTNSNNLLQQAPNAPNQTRSNIFTNHNNIRYPPRIPRLIRRPLVHRDLEGNIIDRPSSISSAISMTREYAASRQTEIIPPVANTIGADAYHRIDTSLSSVYDLQCAFDEKAVDLADLCQMEIKESPSNTNFVPLEFEVVYEDGGEYSTPYNVENILRNDGAVYCSEKCGTINIMLRYKGHNGCNRICSLSHIIVKSPVHGYTAPCKEGMIFISHKPIDVENTRAFDLFTKENYDKYFEMNRNNLDDTDPVAWFNATEDRLSVINMKERSGQYVLVKLLRSDIESENMDLQYIGFVGYSGSRCFAQGKIC